MRQWRISRTVPPPSEVFMGRSATSDIIWLQPALASGTTFAEH